MKLFAFFTFLTGATLVAALPNYRRNTTLDDRRGGRDCGTHISPEHQRNVESIFRTFRTPPSMFNDPDSEPTQIDVYWFVVAANRTLEGGWLPHQQIREQMRVLNEDFNQTHVIFKHIKTTRIIQPTWFADMDIDSPLEKAMKKRFRRGGPGTLNVYTVGLESTGLLGWAAFPADFDSDQANDGIVLRHTTLPGGSYEPYNGGRTLTHEAGHWVGLYHTFQDGCDGGDDVSDTAPEAEPAYGCPIGRDTCPGGGPDPVQNFMDYSDDSCMTGFTKGQIDRLQNQLRVFRELAV